jgi:hypothetical protein
MALILVVAGLLLWLLGGYLVLGVVLIVVGLILWLTVEGIPYGYRRRGPP